MLPTQVFLTIFDAVRRMRGGIAFSHLLKDGQRAYPVLPVDDEHTLPLDPRYTDRPGEGQPGIQFGLCYGKRAGRAEGPLLTPDR